MQTVSFMKLVQARGKLYEFMSAQFAGPPDAEMLALLADWANEQVASEGVGEWLSPEMNDALAAVGAFLGSASGASWESLSEQVAIEYTRLFRGIKKEYSPPPPYESVYREEDGRVFGELTTVVRNRYRRHRFDVASGLTSEPSDHISLELEFMHLLCTREAEALAARDDEAASVVRLAQREFLEEHLLAWTPSLCQEVEKFDRGGLFSGLLKFTEGWLDFDYRNHVVGG